MMRILLFILGVAVAAAGGVMAYRAMFLEPDTTIVITSTDVQQYPNALRVGGGLVLLLFGAGLAFFGVRPGRRQ